MKLSPSMACCFLVVIVGVGIDARKPGEFTKVWLNSVTLTQSSKNDTFERSSGMTSTVGSTRSNRNPFCV